jgi:4-diphosphocytidyl-2-C-methyl-D-erythritol kinase
MRPKKTIIAPAKINLALHVTGYREDGYHLINSFVTFAQTSDTLIITPSTADSFKISGFFASTLKDEATPNLVTRARDLLRKSANNQPCPMVSIELIKNLPIASGIGGGSADAAATLKGLNDLWNLHLEYKILAKIGLNLGADVPMCLYSKPLFASGIGDIIEPVVAMPPLSLLLVNPLISVSTALIFKSLNNKTNPALPPLTTDFMTWLTTETRNDLEPPAIRLFPEIARVLAEINASNAFLSRMSGSGATCFGIFETNALRDAAYEELKNKHPTWWIAK